MMQEEDSSQAFFGSSDSSRRYDSRSNPTPATYTPPVVPLEQPTQDFYTSSGVQAPRDSGQDPLVNQPVYTDRKNNFPPCKPMVYHDIQAEIPAAKRMLVKRAYFGWYIHALCLLFNWVCMFGALIKAGALMGFFIALAAMILGVPVSFWVYWLFYTCIRKGSAFYYCLWLCFFALQIGVEILYAIGVESTGGAGFVGMLSHFSNSVILGSMFAVCTFMWVAIAVYNIYFFNHARKEYANMGGNQAATREFGKVAVNTAYDKERR